MWPSMPYKLCFKLRRVPLSGTLNITCVVKWIYIYFKGIQLCQNIKRLASFPKRNKCALNELLFFLSINLKKHRRPKGIFFPFRVDTFQDTARRTGKQTVNHKNCLPCRTDRIAKCISSPSRNVLNIQVHYIKTLRHYHLCPLDEHHPCFSHGDLIPLLQRISK